MKTSIKLLALGMILMGFGTNLNAQVTDVALATATIVTPIAITKDVDMNFGNIAVSTAAGTVELTPAGDRNETGGITLPVTTGTVTAASFTIEGEPGYTYSITLPTTDLVITNTTGIGGETMIVDTFTSDPTPTGTLDGGGSQTLNVGATLNVDGSQVAGVYVSAVGFDVTVNYN